VAAVFSGLREIMSKHLAKYFDNIEKLAGDEKDFAMTVMCNVVGAVVLSRATSDDAVSDKILSAAPKDAARMRRDASIVLNSADSS
jgi:hypothetical protein